MMDTLILEVPGMSCAHCEAAVKGEVSVVPGVATVHVDLDAKLVTVVGTELDLGALTAAIDAAGYEVTGQR
jgi:copper chaperone